MIGQPPIRWRYALSVQMPFEQKQYGALFVSVHFYTDLSIHCSIVNVLLVNQEHTLGLINLLLDLFLEPTYLE